MGDYGAKVSQRGYQVDQAKDYQLEYNSGFPMLPIVDSGAFSVADNVGGTLSNHNLLFVPMFVILHNDVAGGFNNGAVGESHMIDNFGNNLFDMTTTSLSHNGGGGSNNRTGRFYVFGIDLETSFTAPIVESGTAVEVNEAEKDYGIRVAKEGKDVYSEDLRDFTIHSGTRAPLVHSVTPGTYTAASTVTVTHNLGYIPFPFLYWQFSANPGKYQHIPNQAVTVGVNTVSFLNNSGGTGDKYSLVLLKEPLSVN